MNSDKELFRNKTAIVTGGTRGIGRAIVDLLKSMGCYVVYTGTKRKANLDEDNMSRFLTLDFLEESSIIKFIKTIQNLPKINILINNAGANIIEPINQVTLERWEKIIRINLTGAMRLMNVVSRIMIKEKIIGKMLNISSIFGVVSRQKRNSYSSSKFGMIGLTKASALDLAPYGILVNALCPGFVDTDLTKSMLSPKELGALTREVPLQRLAQPHEIAKAAAFLCSDYNTYMTGQTLVVDGGFVIQ